MDKNDYPRLVRWVEVGAPVVIAVSLVGLRWNYLRTVIAAQSLAMAFRLKQEPFLRRPLLGLQQKLQ